MYNTIINHTINMYILTFTNVALLTYILVFLGHIENLKNTHQDMHTETGTFGMHVL